MLLCCGDLQTSEAFSISAACSFAGDLPLDPVPDVDHDPLDRAVEVHNFALGRPRKHRYDVDSFLTAADEVPADLHETHGHLDDSLPV